LPARIPPCRLSNQYTSNGADSRRPNVGADDLRNDEQHVIVQASAMSSVTKSSPVVVNRRRSLFDLALYQSKEPDDVKPIGIPGGSDQNHHWDAAGIQKTNSACSMEGFYPRPEPGKSLLKRDASVNSLATPGTPNSASYSATADTAGLKRSHSSTVSFSNLEIREYNVALSDHPDCSYGPPIQLGWSYCEKQAVSVDEYELSASSRGRHRRTGRELLLTSPERRELLEEGGYSKEELQWAWEEVERVKRERQRYLAANDLLPCHPKTTSRHSLRGGSSPPPTKAASTHHTNNNIGDWVGQLLSWMH
jgi:hypothetical protein